MYSHLRPLPLYGHSGCIHILLMPIHKNNFGGCGVYVFAPGRIQENIPGELFMYWFRAKGVRKVLNAGWPRFGSATIWGLKTVSSGSGFQFWRCLKGRALSVFQYSWTEGDGGGGGGMTGSICHFAFSLVLQCLGVPRYPRAWKNSTKSVIVTPLFVCPK